MTDDEKCQTINDSTDCQYRAEGTCPSAGCLGTNTRPGGRACCRCTRHPRHRHQVRMGCRHQTSRTTHDRSTHLLCCCTLGGRHWQRPSVRLHAAPGTQATRAHLSVRELNARLAEHKDNCTFNAFAVAQEVSDVASTVVAAAVHVGLLQIGSHHCIYVCSN